MVSYSKCSEPWPPFANFLFFVVLFRRNLRREKSSHLCDAILFYNTCNRNMSNYWSNKVAFLALFYKGSYWLALSSKMVNTSFSSLLLGQDEKIAQLLTFSKKTVAEMVKYFILYITRLLWNLLLFRSDISEAVPNGFSHYSCAHCNSIYLHITLLTLLFNVHFATVPKLIYQARAPLCYALYNLTVCNQVLW